MPAQGNCAQLLQTWPKVITITGSEVHRKKAIYRISAQYVKACTTRVWKTLFQEFKFQKGYNSDKIDENCWHSSLIWSSLNESHIYKISDQYVKTHRKKCWKLCTSTLSSKRGLTLTKLDVTRTWSDVHSMKIKYKIQLNMPKNVREKCGKLCVSSILSSKMGHNFYKTWRKLTTLKLDL